MSTATTSIRISTDTRDRLNALAAELGVSVDAAICWLFDERWKQTCITQADQWRENNPEQWRDHLNNTETTTDDYWAAA